MANTEARYKRTLAPDEQEVIDAQEAADRAVRHARAEAQRLAYFFGDKEEEPTE